VMSAKGERGVIWWERCVMFGTMGAGSYIFLPPLAPPLVACCFFAPAFAVLETMLQMAIIHTSDRAGQQMRHFELNILEVDQTGS